MKIENYCIARFVPHCISSNEVVIGEGPKTIRMDAKDSLRWYDRLIAIFFGILWIQLIVRDITDLSQKAIYVRVNQLGTIIGTDPFSLDRSELQRRFYEFANIKRERWKRLAPIMTRLIQEIYDEQIDTYKIERLNELIEINKYSWSASILESDVKVRKIPKSGAQQFSIYLLRPDDSDEVRIIINLGKKYKFQNPDLLRALDYDMMELSAFLKVKKASSPNGVFLSMSSCVVQSKHNGRKTTYALIPRVDALQIQEQAVRLNSGRLQSVLQTLTPPCKLNPIQIETLCRKIEQMRPLWNYQLRINNDSIIKFKKDNELQFSIYAIKRNQNLVSKPNRKKRIKIILNLGKRYSLGKGDYKTVTKVIDFTLMEICAFARAKLTSKTSKESAEGKLAYTQNEIEVLRELNGQPGVLSSVYAGTIKVSAYPVSYILLDYCEFGDLHSYLNKLMPNDIPQIMKDLLDGLKAIHIKGRAHSDLKTENILLYKNKRTKQIRARICDFGFSFREEDCKPVFGNLLFASPFKLRGVNYPIQADIWALGIIFYNLLYGEAIYEAVANVSWKIKEDKCLLASRFEEKYAQDLPFATGKLNQLIFNMINPNPFEILTLEQVKAAYGKLTKDDFVLEEHIVKQFRFF